MKAKIVTAAFCTLLYTSTIHSITFVYNLRIAETTRTRNTAFGKLKPNVMALTPVALFRGYETDFHQSAGGVLGDYIYAADDDGNWYMRVSAAIGRVHANGPAVGEFGATQFDDILITGGYGWQMGETTRISFSGNLGIPVHSDHAADLAELGTGHVGLGLQLDGIHGFNDIQSLAIAARLICFLSRSVVATIAGNTIYIPHFRLGNALDIYAVYQHSFHDPKHMVTAGYDLTYTFGTDNILAPESVGTLTTTQNSLFATYRYAFPIKEEYLSAIIVGFSYGFLNVPAPLNHGYSATMWLTWGINF